MTGRLFDLAAIGGLFLLAMLLPAAWSDGAVPLDLGSGGLALAIVGAAGVGAAILLFASGFTADFILGAFVSTGIERWAPTSWSIASAHAGNDSDGYTRRVAVAHALLTCPEPARLWIEARLAAAESSINGTIAVVLGLIASMIAYGVPSGAGWLPTGFGIVLTMLVGFDMWITGNYCRRVLIVSIDAKPTIPEPGLDRDEDGG